MCVSVCEQGLFSKLRMRGMMVVSGPAQQGADARGDPQSLLRAARAAFVVCLAQRAVACVAHLHNFSVRTARAGPISHLCRHLEHRQFAVAVSTGPASPIPTRICHVDVSDETGKERADRAKKAHTRPNGAVCFLETEPQCCATIAPAKAHPVGRQVQRKRRRGRAAARASCRLHANRKNWQ
jgi:hypothetical protein